MDGHRPIKIAGFTPPALHTKIYLEPNNTSLTLASIEYKKVEMADASNEFLDGRRQYKLQRKEHIKQRHIADVFLEVGMIRYKEY